MATDQIFAKNEKLTEIVNIKTRRLEDLKVREREKISLELLFNILTKNDSRAFQFICTFPLNFCCKIFLTKNESGDRGARKCPRGAVAGQ